MKPTVDDLHEELRSCRRSLRLRRNSAECKENARKRSREIMQELSEVNTLWSIVTPVDASCGVYRNIGEGPWHTEESAFDFAHAEVAVPYVIVKRRCTASA